MLELLIVVALIACVAAGANLALRESADGDLEKDANRLAALLESGRARSRASGVPVYWAVQGRGFEFQGQPARSLPRHWLGRTTQANPVEPIVLGPEPLIAPAAVALSRSDRPGRTIWVASDGLQPFRVQNDFPGGRP